MSLQSRSLMAFVDKYFREILDKENITEVCYNGTDTIFSLDNFGQWEEHYTTLDTKKALSLITSISSARDSDINKDTPILSATLDKGERVQMVISPATKVNIVSITIRKPSNFQIGMDEYEKQKLFEISNKSDENEDELLRLYNNKDYRSFIENAVRIGKTIVVSGSTGSGKTTFMKTLIDYIPHSERLISIEDVEELTFNNHKNYVQLFYPSEARNTDFLTATSLLKSCLRMKPDRIILAELRGSETFDFINIINSGHSGSITSCHAGSVAETFRRLGLMTLQNTNGQKIPFEVIQKTLKNTIDVVVHMSNTKAGRRITEIYYKGYEDTKKEIA